MSRYRAATRAALVAALKAAPDLGAPVYANPPTNLVEKLILIGDIAFEEPISKTEPGGWCNFNIEVWFQTFSPAEVDGIADAVVTRLDGQTPAMAGRDFSPAMFIGEQVQTLPIEAGGPVFGRILAFRIFVE
jgi:hypothetical protein